MSRPQPQDPSPAGAAQRLQGRRVLVTGASSGIGAATARAIAAAGGRVALVARSTDRLGSLVTEILGATGGADPPPSSVTDEATVVRAVALPGDVVDPTAAAAAVQGAVERLGGLDAVVNAAGVARPGPVATTPPEDWQLMLDVNVRGLLHVTQAALPHLTAAVDAGHEARSGAVTGEAATGDATAGAAHRWPADIVNVSSMSGRRVGSPSMGVYAASKAAVHALSDALRAEVGPDGVRVAVIAPGFVRTGIFEGQDTEAARELGRRGEQIGLPAAQVADRIVDVLAAPAGTVHVEVAMVSRDQ